MPARPDSHPIHRLISPPPVVNIAYCNDDVQLYQRIRQRLEPLQRAHQLCVTRLVQVSGSRIASLKARAVLSAAGLYMPLLSPAFVASKARRAQLEFAAGLARQGRLQIVPILARPLDLGSTPLAGFRTVGEGGVGGLGPMFERRGGAATRGASRRWNSGVRRVLYAMSGPSGWDPLSLGAEQRGVREATRGSGLEIDFRPSVTLSELHDELLSERLDVLHFSGHFDERRLIMSDGGGEPRAIALDAFFNLVRGRVRVLVLSACDTASMARGARGIDYIVAMDGPVEDLAAVEFSRFFYRSLGRNLGIEAAYEDGLNGAQAVGGRRIRPVLFSPDGSVRGPAGFN